MSKRSLVKKRWIKALTASMTDNANVKVFEVIKNNNKLFISETPQSGIERMSKKELKRLFKQRSLIQRIIDYFTFKKKYKKLIEARYITEELTIKEQDD